MSSALTYNPNAFQAGVAMHDRQAERIRRQAMSPRQLELNRMWAFYFCDQYESRTTSWDGRPVLSAIERDSIAHTQVLPPGFWDPGGKFDDVPLNMRKPIAPYHLTRVVVNRFTGLLFSASRHPQISVAGDLPPEQRIQISDWIEGLAKAARLWIRFAYARAFGGSMGAVCTTFRFKAGRPVIEVHDPRWCTPTITDPSTGEVSAIEIRYIYQVEMYDAKGIIQQVDHWYRRIIDENSDVRFEPTPVGEGDEPAWIEAERVDHNLGEFPGVWIRNSQSDQQDGEPDCHGLFDTQEAIDRLLSQADQGAVENCDPTLVVTSNELKVSELRKGSRNAIKLEIGGTAQYAEIAGAGIKSAVDMAQVHRNNFLEVAQCILENDASGAAMTATEIERRYSSMHERGDLFREQYGEMGVKPFVGKMIRAALRLMRGQLDAAGTIVVGQVFVAPRENEDGSFTERQLPPGLEKITDDQIELKWPSWIKRGPADAMAAAGAVATARSAQCLDQESGVAYLARYFEVDNPADVYQKLVTEGGSVDATMMAGLQASSAPAAATAPAATAPAAPPEREPLTGPQIASILTILGAVKTGAITRASGIALVKLALLVDDAHAAEIVGPDPATVAPPAAPPTPPSPPSGPPTPSPPPPPGNNP